MLLLNERLLLKAYISLSTQSGNFWTHPRRGVDLHVNSYCFGLEGN